MTDYMWCRLSQNAHNDDVRVAEEIDSSILNCWWTRIKLRSPEPGKYYITLVSNGFTGSAPITQHR